jgi:hypothetical protein
MKTLAVCYSKTGNTKTVAGAVVKKLGCDLDVLQYDEKTKMVTPSRDPAEYDRVVLLSPVWAFSLSEPMKLYLDAHSRGIKAYSLIVTCGLFGLGGCVGHCKKVIGRPPEKALKIKAKAVKQGSFSLSDIFAQ